MIKTKTSLKAGKITIYGSSSCGWCQKQKNYLNSKGIAYTFIDCSTNSCPDFVKAFPTIDNNGIISEGYQEL
ncbi:MAG: glutaredoxin family protein [Desulfobacterales bacterium]|nr:glutaredoxin family protein [Desulfobacterales bacterium]